MTDLTRATDDPPAPNADADAATSTLVVRRPRWSEAVRLDDLFDGDLSEACDLVALSLVLPSLEPFLIRTLRSVLDRLPAALAADVAAFCSQEAQHHGQHARVNRQLCQELGTATSQRLAVVEADLEADYRRFSSANAPLRNVAYAEGFEAMTCAMAITALDAAARGERGGGSGPWRELWAWHMAEEVEHRTVAFDVYEALGGNYRYRVAASAWAQAHVARYVDRFHRILMDHHGAPRPALHVPGMLRRAWRRHLATFGPRYDPARVEVPPVVEVVLAAFQGTPAGRGGPEVTA